MNCSILIIITGERIKMKFKLDRFIEVRNVFYLCGEMSGVKRAILPFIIVFLFIYFTKIISAKESIPVPDFIYNGRTIDAKAIGLGEAFVAVCDNPSAVYWNPAGLKFLNRRYFSTSINILRETDASDTDLFVNDSLKGKKLIFLGLTGNRKAISYMPITNYSGVYENKNIELRANKYLFSSASQYSEFMTMGININYISATFGETDMVKSEVNIADGNGLSFDLGFLYTFFNPIRLGLSIRDFPGYIWWNDYKTQKLKHHLRAGISTKITDWFLLASDYENIFSIKKEFYHFGLQQTIINNISLRQGIVSEKLFSNSISKYYTFGIGYEITGLTIDVSCKTYELNDAENKKVNDYVLSLNIPL